MVALSTWAPEDGVLGAIAPLALAAACDTALVVDLDPAGPGYPGSGSLAAMVRDSPTASDLSPLRRGVAVLRNGGILPDEGREVIEALLAGWLRVVFRLGRHRPPGFDGVVPVRPLLPSEWLEPLDVAAVYQPFGLRTEPPGRSIVLPRMALATARALVAGALPRRDRWLRAWGDVWEHPWH
jgi:hypothetical protein